MVRSGGNILAAMVAVAPALAGVSLGALGAGPVQADVLSQASDRLGTTWTPEYRRSGGRVWTEPRTRRGGSSVFDAVH